MIFLAILATRRLGSQERENIGSFGDHGDLLVMVEGCSYPANQFVLAVDNLDTGEFSLLSAQAFCV
jgi:hypothetical protein